MRLARWFRFRRVRTFRFRLGDPLPALADVDGPFDFRPLDRADFERDAIFQETERRAHFIRRLEDAHRCHGFVDTEGNVASYLWVTAPAFGVSEAPFEEGLFGRVAPNETYIWDCRTGRPFRGAGFYREGLKRSLVLARGNGSEHAWIVCDRDNLASVKGISAAGFADAGGLLLCRVLDLVVVLGGGLRVAKRGRAVAIGNWQAEVSMNPESAS